MNFGLSFSYVFQEEEWFRKLILPGLCMLIPVIGWMIALGWALRITQNVIAGDKNPLPKLDFGNDLLKGFFIFVIGFVYSLPADILSTLSGWLGRWNFYNMEYGNLLTTVFAGRLGLLAFLIGLFTSFMALAVMLNVAAKYDFGAARHLGEVFCLLKSNIGGWLLTALGAILALGIIKPLGSLACILDLAVTLTCGLAILGHLMGQAYQPAKNLLHQ